MTDEREIVEGISQIPAEAPGSHSYVFYGEHLTVVVDTGLQSNAKRIRKVLGGAPDLIINTHEHFDHIGGNKDFQDETTIAAHRLSAVKMNHGDDEVLQCRANKQDISGYKVHYWLQNNTLFDIGGMHLKVLHTPGHTSGCICLYESRSRTLVSGDTVFANGTISLITRSGSYGDYLNSLGRLKTLKVDRICPGHGEMVLNSRETEETLRKSIENAEVKLQEMKEGDIHEDPALEDYDAV